MKSGNLYRYSCSTPEESEVSLLEKEVSEYLGLRFAVAVNSCGSALYIALLCAGVKPGDKVLMPAFTYTAVPSAIVHAYATPVLVECRDNYCIDPEDLKKKITPDTKVLLLSHMRGHVADMDKIVDICQTNNICLIEDCAHSLGVLWNNIPTGNFGKIACFSTQSHKMMNSGEGGLLATNDDLVITKAILYAGSQENFWQRHFAKTNYFEELQNYIPNLSMRMSNLTAAIIRTQIPYIEQRVKNFNEKYFALESIISNSKYIDVPKQYPQVRIASDTIQFNLKHFDREEVIEFFKIIKMEGIPIKIFGYLDNPRYFPSWKYLGNVNDLPYTYNLPYTKDFLCYACDLRLPSCLTMNDISVIGDTILRVIQYMVILNSNGQDCSDAL